jgi:radical SAM superfamily enzyme YgiQ (UPF0313 family)
MPRIAFITYQYGYAEPFGVMHLSTIAKRRGFETRLFQILQDSVDTVLAYKPDILAYSILSSQAEDALAFNRQLRGRTSAVSIMGGPHPTFFPQVVQDPDLDAVCVGEGELAFDEFLAHYQDPAAWNQIKNITTTGQPPELYPLITDFEAIGFPDRELIYADPLLARQKMKSFFAGRGCPYKCTYCFNHAFNRMYRGKGPIVRKRAVDHLIEEIKQVRARWGMEFIRFHDDCFCLKADDWLEEFADKYPRQVGLPFYVSLRLSSVTREMVTLLKKAGCVSCGTSIESSRYQIRKDVLRRGNETDTGITRAYRLIHEQGLRVMANCMYGLPHSTVEDDLKSLELMIANKVDLCSATVFTPFPGTDIYKLCVEDKLIAPYGIGDIPKCTWNESVLNCFTPQQKNFQANLAKFSPLLGRFPSLRPLFYRLARLRPNRLFLIFHYLGYLAGWQKALPMRLGLKDILLFMANTKNVFLDRRRK